MKLLNEIFKKLRLDRGGKSLGNFPFKWLTETSKCFSDLICEMGSRLPEILQLEMLKFSSLVRLVNQKGKILISLCERSREVRLGKP